MSTISIQAIYNPKGIFLLIVMILVIMLISSITMHKTLTMAKPISIPLDYVLPIPDTKVTEPIFLFKGITLFDDRGIDLGVGDDFKPDNKNGLFINTLSK